MQDAAYATVASLNTTAQGYATAVQTALEGTSADDSDAATIAGAAPAFVCKPKTL